MPPIGDPKRGGVQKGSSGAGGCVYKLRWYALAFEIDVKKVQELNGRRSCSRDNHLRIQWRGVRWRIQWLCWTLGPEQVFLKVQSNSVIETIRSRKLHNIHKPEWILSAPVPSLNLSNHLYLNPNNNKRLFGDFLLINASYYKICVHSPILWRVALSMSLHCWNVTRSRVLSTAIMDKTLRSGSLRIVRSTILSIFDNADNISDEDGGTCSVEDTTYRSSTQSRGCRIPSLVVGWVGHGVHWQ